MQHLTNEELRKIKRLINKFSDIKIIPNKNLERDSFLASLSFFYSLKKLNKNVNLECDSSPKKFDFLVKKDVVQFSDADFVISINEDNAHLSQIFYEKTSQGINLYLKTNGGQLKKENIILKPLSTNILLITLGIPTLNEIDFSRKSDQISIINIDINPKNENFGDVNIVEEAPSFSEVVFDIIYSIDEEILDQEIANTLLAGIIYGTKFFQDDQLNPNTFKILSQLLEEGANFKYILSQIFQVKKSSVFRLLKRVFSKIEFLPEYNLITLTIKKTDFQETSTAPADLASVLEKIIFISFPLQNLLCLWENNLKTGYSIQGLFYSPNNHLIKKVSEMFQGEIKGDALIFKSQNQNINDLLNSVLKMLY